MSRLVKIKSITHYWSRNCRDAITRAVPEATRPARRNDISDPHPTAYHWAHTGPAREAARRHCAIYASWNINEHFKTQNS